MKRSISILLTAFLGASLMLGGCGGSGQGSAAKDTAASATQAETPSPDSQETGSSGSEDTGSSEESGSNSPAGSAKELTADGSGDEPKLTCQAGIRVGSLKGPTSMGLVSLMDKAAKGETSNVYEFTMTGKADELVGKIANGDLDIALVPANVASVLYAKTQGNVTVLDINTLGVLYVVASDDSITSMADLKGRTIYMTGKGTTPEYVMNYLLRENGLGSGDVDLQFKSEATEVASILKQDSSAIGVLPQPFATAACIQNEDLKTVLDLTEQWDMLNRDSGSMLVTGVTLVRSDFLRENRSPIEDFLKDHAESALFTSGHPEEAAALIAAQDIVEKAPIAQKALPYCNIVCITGQEMKDALSGYLSILMEQDAKSIGGQMPGDDFYYMP
ncbi:PhnD/SsuA/transferrin family substrate-binding protein [Lachnoclostridium pacaense]|uniref:ABC transporter substrate-binding protein n=1 Tax=Enterocloster hominis (ex Hitch et al. 2024) TaxID=1917870 RepID=UPI001D106F24|nr:PhnD/SsuA/transferrin family substrate-binding protein [Lachnoclostridium pacaense]MCC2816960.1 PhnD/SsuA/transferrin family substrate-binding protein [Lachnoclostridium pacaense]